RRLWVEPFEGQVMHTLESLQAATASGASVPLMPLDAALQHLPALELSVTDAARVLLGQRVYAASSEPVPRVRLYDGQGRFLGLGELDGSGGLQPRRLLRQP